MTAADLPALIEAMAAAYHHRTDVHAGAASDDAAACGEVAGTIEASSPTELVAMEPGRELFFPREQHWHPLVIDRRDQRVRRGGEEGIDLEIELRAIVARPVERVQVTFSCKFSVTKIGASSDGETVEAWGRIQR